MTEALGAEKGERAAGRQGYRSGYYGRRLCHGNSIEHALRAETRRASCRCDGIFPLCGSFGSEDPPCGSGDEVGLKVEGIVNRTVQAEEELGGSSRLEPLHFALSSSHRLMRVFGPIVFVQPLLMRAVQSQTPEWAAVGAQLVGDQQFRREALVFEQLAYQPERRPSIAPTLN